MLRISPELLDYLELHREDDSEIEVVFVLDPASHRGRPQPRSVKAQAARLVKKVQAESGSKPSDWNVFGRLGAFAVRARPRFVKLMLDQDGIAGAMPNRS